MPVYLPKQRSFLDIEAEARVRLNVGSLQWLLTVYRDQLFPPWLADGWTRGAGMGREAFPFQSLCALWVLRWSEEGASRRGACRRANSDVGWQVAMGLPVLGRTPSARTLADFEAFMEGIHEPTGQARYLVLHEHVVHLVRWLIDHKGKAPIWVADSTPMWCYGAVLDTVRLLGDGLRILVRRYARAAGRKVGRIAKELGCDLLLAKSTKGHLRIDWTDPDARSGVLSKLVGDVIRVVGWVQDRLPRVRASERPTLVGLCDTLLDVIEKDLEQDQKGRWAIARKVARGRRVSITDQDARHGHKSRSESFWGFKLHVLGDAVAGLIAAVKVTPGNVHDAEPGHELVARILEMRIELRQLLADTAYGGTSHRLRLRALGVELVAPPPPIAEVDEAKKKRFGRHDFDVDMELGVATCPNDVQTSQLETVNTKKEGPVPLAFRWPVGACAACPLQAKCLEKPISTAPRRGRPQKGRRLELHPYEADLVAARKQWQDPARRELYRSRSTGERLHVRLLQHGARYARSWGLAAANQQAHAIAIRSNLGLLAQELAAVLAKPGLRRAA